MAPAAKQSSIILYLIMVLGLVVGFLYNSQSDPTAAVPLVSPAFEISSLRGLESLHIDYAVLQSPAFQQLRTFGELPVQTRQGGSTNPFQ